MNAAEAAMVVGTITTRGSRPASTPAAAITGRSTAVVAVVEVTSWRPEKRIITFKTDAYNQEKTQVVTGQSVLMVE